MADLPADQNPENIQPGDTVWLKSDSAKEQAMDVEDVDYYMDEMDILTFKPSSEHDPTKPLMAKCVWRIRGKAERDTFLVINLTKVRPS